MSLSVDGIWKSGVWATTAWANGVWREGAYVPAAAQEETVGGHFGGDYSQPTRVKTKRPKQSKAIRQELERLFQKAETVVHKIERPQPPAPVLPIARHPILIPTADIAPALELQAIIADLQAIQVAMTGPQLQRLMAIEQEAQRRQRFNILARAALLAA